MTCKKTRQEFFHNNKTKNEVFSLAKQNNVLMKKLKLT